MSKSGTIFLAVAVLLGVSACAASSQTGVQTLFELEGSVSKPAPVPADVIAVLKSDERVDVCFRTEGAGTDEAAWFEAAELDLNGDRRADLIIKPKHSCLFGANQGPFWIFQNMPDGYQKILAESGLSLKVLPEKANSFNTIQISKVVGMKASETRFRFEQGKYRPER